MKIKKIYIWEVLEYSIAFLSIILSATMWVQPEIRIFDLGIWTLITVCLVILLCLFYRFRIDKQEVVGIFCILICLLLCVIIHLPYAESTVATLYPIPFFFCFSLVCNRADRINDVLNAFVNIMCLIALLSLFFYAVALLFNIILPSNYYALDWSWIPKVPSYYDLFYDPVPKEIVVGSLLLSRNCAIYPEAPMFMYPLVLALLINKLILRDSKRMKNTILIIAIISTFSVTGYIILILLYVCQYLFLSDNKQSAFIKILIILFSVLGIWMVYMLFENKMDTGSGSVRSDHVYASFEVFFSTNGLGCGIGNSTYVARFMKYKQGISIGLPYLLAVGGVPLGVTLIAPLIKCIQLSIKTKQYNRILFSALFFLLLFMTACSFRLHTWFIFGITVFLWSFSDKEQESLDN